MATSIPGAVAYFLTLAQGALPADAVVAFQKELPLYSAPITLQVVGITGDQEPAELGPNYRREEVYSINCTMTAYAGDQDFQARMVEAFAAFELVAVAVGRDASLGQNVRYAEVGNFLFEPEADSKGQSIGQLTFDIRCSARVASLS